MTLAPTADRAAISAACRVARDRSWRAYRAVESFSFSETLPAPDAARPLRRLDPRRAAGPLLRRLLRETWLPDPESIPLPSRKRVAKRASAPPADLSPADTALLESLRAWRLRAAAGKPAYTVANNATLEAIALARPASAAELSGIKGVGPAFLRRYAEDVLGLVGEGRAAA